MMRNPDPKDLQELLDEASGAALILDGTISVSANVRARKAQRLIELISAIEQTPAPKTPVRPNERRDRILAFVIDYKLSHDGNSPTIREICDGLGDSSLSTSVVNFHLDALARAGKILRPARGYQRRAIEVVGGQWFYEPDFTPEHHGVELPNSEAIAHVSPNVTPETLAALDEMAQAAIAQVEAGVR